MITVGIRTSVNKPSDDFWSKESVIYSNTKKAIMPKTKIIEKLKKENLIDGVGVEMVIYADKLPPTYADITSTLKSYGIPVYVTEFAVIMTNVSGSKEQRWLKQADIYYGIVRAVLESKVCNTIIYFNQTDTNSPWEIQKELYEYSVNADPTLFDDNFNPKPAYYAVIQALYKPLP